MKLKVPPPLYLLVFGITMWWLSDALPIMSWNAEISAWLGGLFVACGALIDLSALWGFIRAKTTVNPLQPRKTNALVATGMYRFTRNPMYLGMLLVLCGWGIILQSMSSLLLVPLFFLILTKLQIQPEEAVLVELFGDEYRGYQQRVRRWL